MDTEREPLCLFRGEMEIVIAYNSEDAQALAREYSFYEKDEPIGDFKQVGPGVEIEIEEPDGISAMREQYSYLPLSGRVFVRAKAADWIASHGRGLLGCSEY